MKSIKRQLIPFNLLFCAVGLLLACANSATYNDISVEPRKQQDQSDAKTYVYECSDGYGFVARVRGDKVWLFLSEKTISLPHVPSGSGAQYSEDQITYWSKGDEALLEIGSDKHTNCKSNRAIAIWEDAKLRGYEDKKLFKKNI